MLFRSAAITIALLVACNTTFASPQFLAEWKNIYPFSLSSQRNCQLCHANAEGGEPWNPYGFEIRDIYLEQFGSTQISLAIRSVEQNNSDNDPQGRSNIEEINAGSDPGWAIEPINRWIFKNGDVFTNKPSPFSAPASSEELCLLLTHSNGNASFICL